MSKPDESEIAKATVNEIHKRITRLMEEINNRIEEKQYLMSILDTAESSVKSLPTAVGDPTGGAK